MARHPGKPENGSDAETKNFGPEGDIERTEPSELGLVHPLLGGMALVRNGEPIRDDAIFDQIYPAWARALSYRHWTPVVVAVRAAELLIHGRLEAQILDVGSGVGKFCLVGALATDASFTGIEQRPRCVELASEVARSHHVGRTRFILGDALTMDWRAFTGIYLFNPFQESVTKTADARATTEKLRALRLGTSVVTYWGFGAKMPADYTLTRREFCGRGWLEHWRKQR